MKIFTQAVGVAAFVKKKWHFCFNDNDADGCFPGI